MEISLPAVKAPGAKNSFVRIVFYIIIFVLIVFTIYYFVFLRKIDNNKIALLISEEAKKTENPLATEKILMQGVKEIKSDYGLLKQARIYARETKIDIEKVLVDNAISLAVLYGYIKK